MSDPALRKVRERALLESLLRVEGISAAIQDRESPDFAVTLEGRTIGVEVTELFQSAQDGSPPQQARESAARRIVDLARRKFAETGGPSLRVSVNFPPFASTERLHREDAASRLASLVRRLIAQPGVVHEWRPRERSDLELAELFSYVHVYRQPESFQPHWLVAAAGWVSPLFPVELQARVDDKSRRLATYTQAFPEVWLVLGVLGRDPSQFFDVDAPPPSHSIRSPFHRTYFLDAFVGKAVLLGTL